jgi:hypothetical protein
MPLTNSTARITKNWRGALTMTSRTLPRSDERTGHAEPDRRAT